MNKLNAPRPNHTRNYGQNLMLYRNQLTRYVIAIIIALNILLLTISLYDNPIILLIMILDLTEKLIH